MRRAKLNNTYFAIRHGESEANVTDRVSSRPATALRVCGLTKKGERQAADSVEAARDAGLLGADTLIVSSDYKRARGTAAIAKKILGTPGKTELRRELRERNFGALDGSVCGRNCYEKVWRLDTRDPSHVQFGVESATAVVERTSALVLELEKRFKGRTILLVSHCDPIQLLTSWFMRMPTARHRRLTGLDTIENGEIRKLN